MPWRIIRETLEQASEGKGWFAALDPALRRKRTGDVKAGGGTVTVAVIALSAKMAKADGIALHIEQNVFERVFKSTSGEIENVRRLFRFAQQDKAGFESYARDIARRLGDEATLKHDIYEGLFHIAAADGVLHPLEDEYLAQVAEIFGFSAEEHKKIRARFVDDRNDPYVVLGADRSMSNDELKALYRRLVREEHPDALAARGMPASLIVMADRKLAAINAAWEAVARERGL